MAQHNSKTPTSERDTYRTPDYLFNWLDSVYNFDIDLAASSDNSKTPFYFNLSVDSLEQEWFNDVEDLPVRTGFCNPPYSNIKPWTEKAIEQSLLGFTTVMLIPTPNGEKYYQDVFDHASEIIFINGRISFIDADGNPKGGNTRGSCVVVFSPHLCKNINVSSVRRDDLISRS